MQRRKIPDRLQLTACLIQHHPIQKHPRQPKRRKPEILPGCRRSSQKLRIRKILKFRMKKQILRIRSRPRLKTGTKMKIKTKLRLKKLPVKRSMKLHSDRIRLKFSALRMLSPQEPNLKSVRLPLIFPAFRSLPLKKA